MLPQPLIWIVSSIWVGCIFEPNWTTHLTRLKVSSPIPLWPVIYIQGINKRSTTASTITIQRRWKNSRLEWSNSEHNMTSDFWMKAGPLNKLLNGWNSQIDKLRNLWYERNTPAKNATECTIDAQSLWRIVLNNVAQLRVDLQKLDQIHCNSKEYRKGTHWYWTLIPIKNPDSSVQLTLYDNKLNKLQGMSAVCKTPLSPIN